MIRFFNREDIHKYVSNVNFNIIEITLDLLLGTIFQYILDLDFDDIDLAQSKIEWLTKQSDEIELMLVSKGSQPKIIFNVDKDNIVYIRVGKGEGEYLNWHKMEEWKDIHSLRSTLQDLFIGNLTEEVIYCNGEIIGNNCSIPYTINGVTENYIFKKRIGMCLPWNKKTLDTIVYEPWIKNIE